ncbi:MAG TPA: 2,3-bisphosphoglycerate-independent phosphoglycerate mutase [Candidatus Bipolaricaulota bacterium]|nr:2,3-bisphosphoglycerate-independent phosphoglycerate mutase [Candidatus Bipolaricaulota bacterium]
MQLSYNPVVLIVLDGFGIATPGQSNAISLSSAPFYKKLIGSYPTMLLEASGVNVGLPWGEVGNSEVGHLNIGSGVLHYQSLPRIDKEIEDGNFFKNENLLAAVQKAVQNKSKIHLIGLLGNGGVHAHQRHLEALIKLCKENKLKKQTFLHLFLDGRDSARDSGAGFLEDIMKFCKKQKCGEVASITGRIFGMDRNKNWDKTSQAYSAIAEGKGAISTTDPLKTLKESYQNQIFDEEFPPCAVVDKKNQPLAMVSEEDAVIFFNFRADRAVQLTQAFVEPNFDKFQRNFIDGLTFVTLTDYKTGLPVKVSYPRQTIANPLAKVFSDNGFKQLHIAETEKYAHVTYFLNGQIEEKFPGEDRMLIPSPLVDSYDKQPEMSANIVTDEILKALASDKYQFMAINYANPDMVGHTGNLQATVSAVNAVDSCLEKVISAILAKQGMAFIVGDHGNAEELVNLQTGKIDKEHSIYPVPFIAVSNKHAGQTIQTGENGDLSLNSPLGILSDVAPTILAQVGIPPAPEMTGTNLLQM